MGISNLEFSLRTLIIGYKIYDKDFNWVNQILTTCYFIIFKTYFMASDEKHVNLYAMSRKEFDYRVKIMENIDPKLYLKLKKFVNLF